MIRAKRPVSQPPSFTPRTGARSSLSNARDAGRASSLPKPLPGAKGDQRPSLPRGHPQTTAASAVSAMTAAAGAAAASAATPLIGASAATRSDASRNRRRTYLERLVTELLSRLNALRVTTRSSRVIGFSVRAAVAAVLVSLTAYCSYRLLFVLLWRRPSNKQIPDAEGANSEFKHRSSADADHSPRATPQLKVESSQSTVTEGAHLTSSLSTSTKPSLAIASSGPSSSIPRHVKGLLLTVSVKNVILWSPSRDPLHPNYAFIESAMPFLHSLVASPRYIVHLIAVISSDREQAQIQNLLTRTARLTQSGLDSRRILFCDTEEGKVHIVRHISPHTHVDSDDYVIEKVSQYVKRVIRVARGRRSLDEGDGSAEKHAARSISPSASLTSTSTTSVSSADSGASNRGEVARVDESSVTTQSSSFIRINGSAHPTPPAESKLHEIARPSDLLIRANNVQTVRSIVESDLLA